MNCIENAFRGVAGASVEVLDGPEAGTSATAGATGAFSLTGIFDDTTHFRASREGYVAATGTLAPNTCASCNSRWIYFYLAVLAPAVDIAGDYTLTFMADSTCTALPNELRTRTYVATIAPRSSANLPANTSFDVTVGNAPFLEHYNRFSINVAGDYLYIGIGDSEPGLVGLVVWGGFFFFFYVVVFLLPPDRRRAGVDRLPHRNRQRRTGRRPPGCGRPRQLTGAHWRPGDIDDEREGPTAVSGSTSGSIRARHRAAGVCDPARRGHPHRGGRHY